VLKPQLKN